jgi:hypothetical protein
VIIESGMGLGFITMVSTYLPVLYQLFARRETHVIATQTMSHGWPRWVLLWTLAHCGWPAPEHGHAADIVLSWIESGRMSSRGIGSTKDLDLVAYRVVHRGTCYSDPVQADDEVIATLGTHVPRLWDQDVDLVHHLWLELSEEHGLPSHLDHRDVVCIAVRRPEKELHSPQAADVLEEVRSELSDGR